MRKSVRAWMTRSVLSTTIACVAAAGVVALAIGWLVGSGAASVGGAPGWTTYRDRGDSFTVSFPSAWHRARSRLVPGLLNPGEILSLGTGPMTVGGGGNCGRYPEKAIAAMGPRDVLISVQEDRVAPGADWPHNLPRRPQHFRLRSPDARHELVSHTFTPVRGFDLGGSITEFDFRDRGRVLWALVAFSGSARPQARRDALRVLDSLSFDQSQRR